MIDYNSVTNTTTTPFTNTNAETICQANLYANERLIFNLRFALAGFSVDTLLYRSYNSNDLRSFFYFRPPTSSTVIYTKSGYTGTTTAFAGIATDEMYLIRSECNARFGNVTAAMNDLNLLLSKRWKTGTYIPSTLTNAQQALSLILAERRKELVYRGIRWTDLRRLNKEGANIILTRVLNGQTYTLPPNSPLYTLPIPPDAIALGGYVQNNR